MTDPESKEISDIIKRILVGTYQHNDIKLLLISVRDHTKNRLIRELGDFVAHPKRTKGLMHTRIFRYYDQLAGAMKCGSSTLNVEPPLTEDTTVSNLTAALLDLFPSRAVYIDRLVEQAKGLHLSVMCLVQGASFHRRDVDVHLRWGVGENSNFCLFADFHRKHLGSANDVSIIVFQSSVMLTEVNRLQEPPFGCYVRDGVVTVHMLW
jgi:hypothetical protein